MNELLHDPVMAMWFVLAAMFLMAGFYTALVWWEVRGIRGISLAVLAISLGLLTTLLGIVRAGDAARIPQELVVIGIRVVFPAMFLSMFVLIDMWAADHNDHRSFTTRTYQFFKRLTIERDRRKTVEQLKEFSSERTTHRRDDHEAIL